MIIAFYSIVPLPVADYRPPERLPARRPEAACPARRLAQLSLLPLNGFIASHDQLRDAVAFLEGVFRAAQVEHHHPDLAAIAGIDGAEIHGERVLESEAAAWPNLGLISRRQFDGKPGRHSLRDPRSQYHAFHRP